MDSTQSVLSQTLKPKLHDWREALYEKAPEPIQIETHADLLPYSLPLENWNSELEPFLTALISDSGQTLTSKVDAFIAWFENRLLKNQRLKNMTVAQPNQLKAAAMELQSLYQNQLLKTLQLFEEILYLFDNAKQIGQGEFHLHLDAVDLSTYQALIRPKPQPETNCTPVKEVSTHAAISSFLILLIFILVVNFVLLTLGVFEKSLFAIALILIAALVIYIIFKHPLLALIAIIFGSF